MKTRTIKNKEHILYDDIDEFSKKLKYSLTPGLENIDFVQKAPSHVIDDFKKQAYDIKSSIEKIDQIRKTNVDELKPILVKVLSELTNKLEIINYGFI